MLRGHDILCISSIDWDFVWQGHQEIMSTLAAEGNQVLFLENTGVRTLRFRDLSRLKRRLLNWWRGTKGFRQERENLFVYSPLILPFPYSPVARWVNKFLMLRVLRRWMRAVSFYRPVIWSFLPTPLARDLIRALNPALTVYYCVDDLPSSSPHARRIVQSEIKFFKEADMVFVTSAKLRERAAELTGRVHLFPFGVNYQEFERVRKSSNEVPAEIRDLPRPVVGYVGGVHKWIDQELLRSVAEAMPDASFVLVGPYQTDVSLLARCPNIHLLGVRSHMELPRYIKGFDVGIVPYCLTEYTANVYPTKLNEYLAMGIPVVATDLPEIRRFNTENGNVLEIAGDALAFGSSIRSAIEKNLPAETERRVEAARQNSWEQRIARMSALIEGGLAAKRTAEAGWDETLRHLYRSARRRVARTTFGVMAAYFLFFYTPVIWYLAKPLYVVEPPRPTDAIVAFAGGVGESGKAGGGYQERVKQAVNLYKAGNSAHLVFSSGFVSAFREAEIMKDLAISLGVPASAIILETNASNTYENVVFVHEILDRQGWRSILLVSSPYHMRRALMTWRQVAPEFTVIPTPVPIPQSQFYSHLLGASLEQIRGILHEYLAIVVYWWTGWI